MPDPSTPPPARALDVLRFWFGSDPDQRLANAALWFTPSEAFDAQIREQFGGDVERAAAGELDGWLEHPHGALALVIVLDQFPRNLHRDSGRAFANDPKALACTREALARGHDRALGPVERWFLIMPCMHAEVLAAQDECVRYLQALTEEVRAAVPPQTALAAALAGAADYAVRHREVIARFGRFPHRNPALGRETTPEEQAWLEAHPGGF